MTKIKLCGFSRECDIDKANELKPDYIGFVFVPKRKRYVTPERALELRKRLSSDIKVVGVFINEAPEIVAKLLSDGVIDVAQLHGTEDEAYIKTLRQLTDRYVIKAFRIDTNEDVEKANSSSADMVLLDAGNGGTGTVFDWGLLQNISRPYFLAGGLNPENVEDAVASLKPYGVDVSSGIETDGLKDMDKMTDFVTAVRR